MSGDQGEERPTAPSRTEFDPLDFRCSRGCELHYYDNDGACSCHRPVGPDCDGWDEIPAAEKEGRPRAPFVGGE